MKKIKSRLYRSYKFQFRCMRWQAYSMGAYARYLKLYNSYGYIGWTYSV